MEISTDIDSILMTEKLMRGTALFVGPKVY